MWWKLGILTLATAALIFSIIPIRTHAVLFDPTNPSDLPKWTLRSTLANMYLTSGTIALIVLILIAAVAIGWWIVRH